MASTCTITGPSGIAASGTLHRLPSTPRRVRVRVPRLGVPTRRWGSTPHAGSTERLTLAGRHERPERNHHLWSVRRARPMGRRRGAVRQASGHSPLRRVCRYGPPQPTDPRVGPAPSRPADRPLRRAGRNAPLWQANVKRWQNKAHHATQRRNRWKRRAEALEAAAAVIVSRRCDIYVEPYTCISERAEERDICDPCRLREAMHSGRPTNG